MDAKRKLKKTRTRRSVVTSAKKKVMIVDDDKDFLEEVREMLVEHGYNTILATSGATVSRSAKRLKPDVILLDIVMRDMNGFQVAGNLNESPETAKIPVIAITGWFIREEHNRLMNTLGIKAILMKPFKPLDLVSSIEGVSGRA